MITDYTREILRKQGGDPDSLPDNLITTHLEAIVANMGSGGGSGGGADIDVTASVGQTIVVEEVDANGKPTKWKAAEYQEKICGEGIVELYNATLTGLAESEALLEGFSMQAGETYYVTWNGVEYTSVCVEVPDTGGICYIGNGVLFELEDTGEPFFILYGTDDGVNFYALAMSADGVDEATVVIKSTCPTPIPVEYLSNAFPYYIEVTGSGTTDDPCVCNDSVENVEAQLNAGRTVYARLRVYGDNDILAYEQIFMYFLRAVYSNGYDISFIGANAGLNSPFLRLKLVPQNDGSYAVSVSDITHN